MASVTKLLGSETDLTSATNVGFAKLLRVYNSGSAAAVTQKNAGGTTLATVTLAAGEILHIQKAPSDTLEGGAAFKVVSVAFTN
jgi:hypothetical protein